jgi:glycosyltransferase involved in cell wall biosynthesis
MQPPLSSPSDQHSLLVSIIIPSYNHGQYLGDAIRSVLDQEYRRFEVIVVDDGSTDNSREVVAQFGDQVRYIWQENQGLSAARNTGIAAARGAYIGLLDADDMYEPDFLSSLVSVLDANPDADGVFCGYRFVDQLNNPLPQVEARLVPDGQLHQTLLDGNFLVPESMLVRRRCYEHVGLFDVTLSACEDWDMWLRITSQHKIVGTTKVLTRHRILPGSMSTDPIRMLNNRLAVLKKQIGDEPASVSERTRIQRRAYGRAYLVSVVEYLQYHNQDGAYECLTGMARVCPELLAQLDTFYQLGCGDQPKGSLGDLASLDVQCNARVLLGLLDRLLGDPQLADNVRGYWRPAYANAYLAIALLNYGARQLQEARRFLLRAAVMSPRYGLRRQFLSLWLKSLLVGTKFVDRVRGMRQHQVLQ